MLKAALTNQNDTDVGNAERLVARYGDEVRYVPAWGTWLVWDGCRWSPDRNNGVILRAKKTIRALRGEADRLPVGDWRRSPLLDHTRRSERAERLRAMVQLAESDPSIVVQPEALDADPWLFNVRNGTLDLRTGRMRPHDCQDYLTKVAPVTYTAGARSEVWEKFLDQAAGGDMDLRGYLQRVTGYSLVGVTHEEIMLLLIGGTATGKSTYIEALKATMGDYACTADFET